MTEADEEGLDEAKKRQFKEEDNESQENKAMETEADKTADKLVNENSEDTPSEPAVELVETSEPDSKELITQLATAEAKIDETTNQLLRQRAEMDNMRKRASRELSEAHKFALERFGNALLPVIDSMELGMVAARSENVDIEKIKEGVDLTSQMLISVLEKSGIESISPEIGEKLNPELHQAMTVQEDSSVEPNSILTIVQKGYTLSGRLLRPAMVIVAKAVSKQETTESKAADDGKTGIHIDEKA